MQNLLGSDLYRFVDNTIRISSLCEIRLRINRRVYLKTADSGFFIDFKIDENYIKKVVQTATNGSVYAHEQEFNQGYISYKDGIRIGVCGEGFVDERQRLAYKKITSLNIRIPHYISPEYSLFGITEQFSNTLIISPPFGGKTTLIRYLAHELAYANDVTIIDERSEIDIFPHSDNLRIDSIKNVDKLFAMENIIRSMSPDIIVCDEIYGESEINALNRAALCGIKVLASYHASSLKDVPEKLLSIFSVVITLTSTPKPGSIVSIVRK